MISESRRDFLRAVGYVACTAWLGLGLYNEILNKDPSQLSFRDPEVEEQMKNCTSDDPRFKYKCAEKAILANQRSSFLVSVGHGFVIFAPPILVWIMARRWMRPRPGDPNGPPPPSVQRFRVR